MFLFNGEILSGLLAPSASDSFEYGESGTASDASLANQMLAGDLYSVQQTVYLVTPPGTPLRVKSDLPLFPLRGEAISYTNPFAPASDGDWVSAG